jgi:hypothetical protein
MTKQMDETIDHRVPRLYNATVQNRRCWALLNYIIRNEIVIEAPATIKARAKQQERSLARKIA